MGARNILHLIETTELGGGAENVLVNLIRHLDRREFYSIAGLVRDGSLSQRLRESGVETFIISERRPIDLRFLLGLVALIKRQRIELIHSNEFWMNTYGCMAAMITGVPIITTVHGKNYYWEKFRRRLAYRFAARCSARMVAVSEDIRRFLIGGVGAAPYNLVTVYNGIDPKRYGPSEEETQKGPNVRTQLGIANTASVVGTVGSLYPVKGHTNLLKAAAQVVKVFPGIVFLIIGKGGLLSQLQDEAAQLKIESSIRFLGFRDDIPELLQAMDIFVLPSLSEGVPLSLLEAMAAGKPVVATHVGGNPEVVVDEETGFLVQPNDPGNLASRIIVLLKDKPLALKLGVNGQQRLRENFSLERMVNAYRDLYQEALLRK